MPGHKNSNLSVIEMRPRARKNIVRKEDRFAMPMPSLDMSPPITLEMLFPSFTQFMKTGSVVTTRNHSLSIPPAGAQAPVVVTDEVFDIIQRQFTFLADLKNSRVVDIGLKSSNSIRRILGIERALNQASVENKTAFSEKEDLAKIMADKSLLAQLAAQERITPDQYLAARNAQLREQFEFILSRMQGANYYMKELGCEIAPQRLEKIRYLASAQSIQRSIEEQKKKLLTPPDIDHANAALSLNSESNRPSSKGKGAAALAVMASSDYISVPVQTVADTGWVQQAMTKVNARRAAIVREAGWHIVSRGSDTVSAKPKTHSTNSRTRKSAISSDPGTPQPA